MSGMCKKGVAYLKAPARAELAPLQAQLRELRYKRGISQSALAERAGYSLRTVKEWELGECAPNLYSLQDWVEALGARLEIVEDENDADVHDVEGQV